MSKSKAEAPTKHFKERGKPIVADAVTEPGFLFEAGNAVISFPASHKAGFISLGVAALALAVSVARHSRRLGVRLPQIFNKAGAGGRMSTLFNKLVDNAGLGMNISGAALLTASGITAYENIDMQHLLDMDWGYLKQEGREALIIGCYGLANTSMGLARAVKPGSNLQRTLDSIGISFSAAGSILAGDNSNMFIKSLFGASAGLSIAQAFKIMPSHYQSGAKKYPLAAEYLAAGGYAGNAVTSTTPELQIANVGFLIAYLSIHALKETKGKGLYEYLNKYMKFDKKHAAFTQKQDEQEFQPQP